MIRALAALGGALALASCGQAPLQPVWTDYRCADGRAFAARFAADGSDAVVAIDGMHFRLQRDGERLRYQCSELSLTRDGDTARLQFTGAPESAGCRALPAPAR